MTMPHERLRALIWAGELLRDLLRNQGRQAEWFGGPTPQALHEVVVRVLRHYPEPLDLKFAPLMEEPVSSWLARDPWAPKEE